MADDYRRIELITGEARRRHWTTEQKLQIIEESSFRVRRYRRLLGYVAWRQISFIDGVEVSCWPRLPSWGFSEGEGDGINGIGSFE